MPTRSEYVTMIWVYKARRKLIKDKWGTGKTVQLTKKISQWTKEIKRIDKRNEIIGNLIESVNNYFDVKIESKCMDAAHKLARKVYYKYGIETRMQGVWISKAIGMSRVHTATESRRIFTQSFKTNEYHKSIYHRFKAYLKDNESI